MLDIKLPIATSKLSPTSSASMASPAGGTPSEDNEAALDNTYYKLFPSDPTMQ